MGETIIDRGRGPELSGTRITVHDVWHYASQELGYSAIAAVLRISPEQALAALSYIEDNKERLLPEFERNSRRIAKGNGPHVESRLREVHRRFERRLSELGVSVVGVKDARHPG